MNKVILTGRITKDPELKYTANGISNIKFSLAVDRGVKDASGNKQSDFINCVVFGTTADFMSKYIKKGFMLAVEGKIQTGSYTNQQGQTIYTTDVFVDRLENLTPRDNSSYQNNQQQPQYQNNGNVYSSEDDAQLPF